MKKNKETLQLDPPVELAMRLFVEVGESEYGR